MAVDAPVRPAPAFIRAWAAGVIVLVATEVLQASLVNDHLVGPEGVRSFGAALGLVHLPNLVCVVLATWAAARMHPEPWRDVPWQHAVAACAVPVAAQILSLTLHHERGGLGTLGFWMSTGVLLAGCALGMLVDGWREESR
ncbi:hypothetical protein GCM10009535_05570 [Streptomyces thermocarboxydovorans]|uniref:Integral membrane protein n=1 Tax=Streptomyces thermocarboxydovorans TaxID=59298 RepID=A0ABN1H874_9ACTN